MRLNPLPAIFRVFIFLVSFSLLGTAAGVARETKTLVLKNGLSVMVVQEPEAHRSAAALAVGTGQLYDPDNEMGLAHYLEHMLFLGTKKYPEVGSYKKYLTEHSGASNAYTASSITNYFFEVSHDGFEGALDRFSDFFKSPLFLKKYAEREINAVNSEHDKNRRSDGWRAGYVKDLTAEPGHPMRKFGTGNKETLAGVTRDELMDFYKKYYVASNMKLALVSNLPVAKQVELARKYFEDIPDHPVKLPWIDPQYRRPLKNQYRFLRIKTIRDVRSLSLEFPTIRLKDHQDSKPSSIVGSVIGHEGKGSLLSKLKEEGLALGLSAGGGYDHPNLNSFSISISLTKKGVAQYKRVLELVFSYIRMLKEHGIEEYTFKENQTMAQIDFDWKDPEEGMGFAASRASMMHNFKLEEVETLPFLFKKYDPEAYQALIDTLTPENALVVLRTNSVKTDRKENIYGTEYSLVTVGGEDFERLKNPPVVPELSYPARNEFIPYNLKLVEEDPHLVRDDEIARVWFKFDHRFKQPKVFMKLRIETPLIYDTVKHAMLANLYDTAIHEGLNEIVYPIQLAGLSYALGVEKKGVTLTIGGYSERISDLLRLVARNLLQIKIDQQKFDNLREAMIRGLENSKLGQAYARGGYYTRLLWLVKQYTEDEKINALKSITFDELKAYTNNLYERIYITGLAHGNWTDADVRESVQTLLSEIRAKPLPKEERFKEEVEVLDPGARILFSKQSKDNNNSISYGLQVGEKSFERQARLSMIASIVESDFYTQMRTNQQLGYIVWSFQRRIEDRLFFKFVIQSASYSPFELNRRVEAWLAKTGELFDKLTDEEFEKHKESIVISLKKEGESIAEVAGDLYYLATVEKGDFKYKKKLIAAVEKLKKEDVRKEALRIFRDPQTPRLVVLMRSSNNNEPVPAGVLTEVKQFKNRKSTQARR